MIEFKEFPKIEHWKGAKMTITQKLHGTNAQIYIGDESTIFVQTKIIKAGSRNRWLTPEDDNYGFAAFVYSHYEKLIEKLGVGRHYGEWAGLGINSGEGLKEKRLFLFDHWRFSEKELPAQVSTVPVMYEGEFSFDAIETCLESLRVHGSKVVEGFMHPEGVVIDILGQKFKVVFDPEETAWKSRRKPKVEQIAGPDVSHLLQPIRMKKIFSREERYFRDFPKTLPEICKAYVEDLVAENQIIGDEDEQKAIKKALGRHVFGFAKEMYNE